MVRVVTHGVPKSAKLGFAASVNDSVGEPMETLLCAHVVAYTVEGITLPSGEERELLSRPADRFRCLITSAPNSHLEHGDRSGALAEGLASGWFHADHQDALPERIAASIYRAQTASAKQFGARPFIIMRVEKDIDGNIVAHRNILGSTICFDAVDKEAVRAESRPIVAATLAALASLAEPVCGFNKAADFLELTKSDGTSVFSLSTTFGNAILATTIASPLLAEIPQRYDLIRKASSLVRVSRLIQQSLEQRTDRFRSFLAAWNALEILVNKTFPQYEDAFFAELSSGLGSGVAPGQTRAVYAGRIRTVMKDKYNVADRFALIASALSSATCDNDLQTFREAKKFRDKLSHGDDVLEGLLPADETRRLVQRYFTLHTAARQVAAVETGSH